MFRKNNGFYFYALLFVLIAIFLCTQQAYSQSPDLGDVNQDSIIDIVDALLTAQYYVGLEVSIFLEEAADVDASGAIDIVDALLIAQFYVGLISEFPGQTAAGIEVVKSDTPRNMDPLLEDGELNSVVNGNNSFGFDFFRVIKDEPENLFFSPLSISYAFAMCYAGANGNTAAEIANVMHFTLAEDRFHNAFNELDLRLTSEPVNPDPDIEELKLHIANSIWGQRDYFFYPGFLDTLAINYGAGLNAVDFINQPEPCRILINDWVSEQTEDRINNLLPGGSVTLLTRLVLVNAIYFKANWLLPFEEERTYEEDFYKVDGNTVAIPMMHQTQTTSYYEVPGEFQSVKLNYMGMRSNSMIIILPADGQLNSFESNFTNTVFNTIKQEMSTYRVILTLPKFNFRWGGSIALSLQSLGMVEPFTGQADFSGITNEEELYIGDVIHKAFVAVDEIGTEAAAATAIIMPGSSGPDPTPAPPPLVTMTINRPFLFLICNNNTGTILFIGRVVIPE